MTFNLKQFQIEDDRRFERGFNPQHGNNFHSLVNDGKRSATCDVCAEDKKLNPKGYYLTFLREQKYYWNREMLEDVKSHIHTSQKRLLKQFVEGEIERLSVEKITKESSDFMITVKYTAYNRCLQDQITHYKAVLKELE